MRWLLLLLICLIGPANAQLLQTHAGGAAFVYQGPCDLITSPKVVWGLRAMCSAYATGSNPGVTVRRASDNTTQNINILSSGALDMASANTFAGTDATASCTIATTTATCTGASSTPHVGSTITGSGVTNPCRATAVGTFTGGAGTVTVAGTTGAAPCGTIGSATTLTFQYGLFVSKIFDQSGNGNICTTLVHCDAAQATNANQPQLLPNCFGALPCMFTSSAGQQLATPQVSTGGSAPFTIESVYLRIGTGGSFTDAIQIGAQAEIGPSATAANAYIYSGGSAGNCSAADNASHVLQGVMAAAGNSTCNVDNTATSLSVGNDNISNGQVITIMGGTNGTMNGYWTEGGLWFVGFNSTQQTQLCHNAFSYWGTSVSC